MILIMLTAILAGTLVLAVILTAGNTDVLRRDGGADVAAPADRLCGGGRYRPARLTATVWAHRITPTMQPETWGRRRLPRPFRQSGVLHTED